MKRDITESSHHKSVLPNQFCFVFNVECRLHFKVMFNDVDIAVGLLQEVVAKSVSEEDKLSASKWQLVLKEKEDAFDTDDILESVVTFDYNNDGSKSASFGQTTVIKSGSTEAFLKYSMSFSGIT